MSEPADDAKSVLKSVWEAQGDPALTLDDECSPTKVCRNMQGITFEGFAEDVVDFAPEVLVHRSSSLRISR